MPVLQQEQSLSVTELNALLAGLMALKKGRRGARLPLDWTGVAGKVADAFNDVVELLEASTNELDRISRVVGKEGKINQRASIADASGGWVRRRLRNRRCGGYSSPGAWGASWSRGASGSRRSAGMSR